MFVSTDWRADDFALLTSSDVPAVQAVSVSCPLGKVRIYNVYLYVAGAPLGRAQDLIAEDLAPKRGHSDLYIIAGDCNKREWSDVAERIPADVSADAPLPSDLACATFSQGLGDHQFLSEAGRLRDIAFNAFAGEFAMTPKDATNDQA